MVIFSNHEIACPLVAQGDALVILENSQLKPYEGRVRKGGLLILESTGLKEKVGREDIEIIQIPAVEIATGMGDPLVSGMILLGAYIRASGILPPEFIEKESLLIHNLEAFRKGVEMAARRSK